MREFNESDAEKAERELSDRDWSRREWRRLEEKRRESEGLAGSAQSQGPSQRWTPESTPQEVTRREDLDRSRIPEEVDQQNDLTGAASSDVAKNVKETREKDSIDSKSDDVDETIPIRDMPRGTTVIQDFDLRHVDYLDNPIRDDFNRGGTDRHDYRWAVRVLDEVIRPGVYIGKDRDYFVRLDESRSSSADGPVREAKRSYAHVYDLFYGENRISLNRESDDLLTVNNGRHRIEIARELGIPTLPGEILLPRQLSGRSDRSIYGDSDSGIIVTGDFPDQIGHERALTQHNADVFARLITTLPESIDELKDQAGDAYWLGRSGQRHNINLGRLGEFSDDRGFHVHWSVAAANRDTYNAFCQVTDRRISAIYGHVFSHEFPEATEYEIIIMSEALQASDRELRFRKVHVKDFRLKKNTPLTHEFVVETTLKATDVLTRHQAKRRLDSNDIFERRERCMAFVEIVNERAKAISPSAYDTRAMEEFERKRVEVAKDMLAIGRDQYKSRGRKKRAIRKIRRLLG